MSPPATFRPPGLGRPVPPSDHAVSVSLPTWDDVIGYEEATPRVMNAMQTGYPRFLYHAITEKLFDEAQKKFGTENEFCIVLPSARIAALGKQFCGVGRVEEYSSLHALLLPKGSEAQAKAFWQHVGYIVSSRQAQAALEKRAGADGAAAKRSIIDRLAKLSGERAENIYLFPSGMAAIFTAFEITAAGAPTVQLGFPYVDTLKIQQKFGSDAIFLNDITDFEKLEKTIIEKKPAALFVEFPCNPLITSVDLKELSTLCRAHKVALVVDDTLSSWANADVRPYADIVVSSLTKFFSGVGDVLAGSLILNSGSPLYATLKRRLDALYEDLLFSEDAIVLAANSADFETRMEKINANAEALHDWLAQNYRAVKLYYTKGDAAYETYKKQGYGGIISLVLESEAAAQAFFDALEVCKGPSLGTNYTLAGPYTMLAHYHERAFAENSHVPFHLIRVSVGLEPIEELKTIFAKALKV